MPDDAQPASEASKARTRAPLDQGLEHNPDEQIGALRERLAFFKEKARLLLKGFEQCEISEMKARAEIETLGRDVDEVERQLEEWEAQHPRRS